MIKIRKIALGVNSFTPDVTFTTETGERVRNLELPAGVQVEVYYNLPTEGQTRKWMAIKQKSGRKGTSETEYHTDRLAAVRTCVTKVTGLENVFTDENDVVIPIKDGESLAANHNMAPEIVAIFRQSFDHIMGVNDDAEDFTS